MSVIADYRRLLAGLKFRKNAPQPTIESASVQSFLGTDMRVAMIDGNPWFAAVDVARCIGLEVKNATANIKASVNNAQDVVTAYKKQATPEVQVMLFAGSVGKIAFVSEAGLYAYILRAQTTNPRAVEFQQWVTRVVLPTIRKTGGYIMGEEKLSESPVTLRHKGRDHVAYRQPMPLKSP